jgi:hypothetical protein
VSRDELERRQQHVLQSLLSGAVPDGFDPRSAGLTIQVLRTKRRSEVVAAVPVLRQVPDLVERFDAWAAGHPRHGCAHDDALDFVVDDVGPLPEPLASVRAVERVYRGHAAAAHDRRPRQRPWVVAVGPRVWHLGARNRPSARGKE